MEPKLFFLGLLFIGLLNAIVVSGDGGVSFAKNKSAEMCSDPRVSEVFICVDNTVKVVWAESEKGTTFYSPAGKITDCPPVALGQASAECVRFSMPNYCTKKIECEKKPIENITKNETTYENITEKPSEEKPAEEKPKEEKPSGGGSILDNKPVVIPYTGSSKQQASATGDIFSSPIIIVLAVMIVLLIALYFVFKKTVRPS